MGLCANRPRFLKLQNDLYVAYLKCRAYIDREIERETECVFKKYRLNIIIKISKLGVLNGVKLIYIIYRYHLSPVAQNGNRR